MSRVPDSDLRCTFSHLKEAECGNGPIDRTPDVAMTVRAKRRGGMAGQCGGGVGTRGESVER